MFVRMAILAVGIMILQNVAQLSEEHKMALYTLAYFSIALDLVLSWFKN